MMSNIEIRGEFIRIARAFAGTATGVFDIDNLKHGTSINGIYVEPHASGQGVQIVSTDGAAMCIQWDRKGRVDRPYLICGIDKPTAVDLTGADINERWLVGKPGAMTIERRVLPKTKVTRLPEANFHPVRLNGAPTDEPGVTVYPNWRSAVPARDEIEAMSEGYPGVLNAAYLSIIARLHDDSMANCRAVRLLHSGSINSPVLLQFPWRNDTFVIIAPLEQRETHGWTDMIHPIVSTERISTPAPADDDDDPAAGL